jgi:hypothetical protein
MQHEMQRGILAMAGFRQILQTTLSVGAGVAAGYTVQRANTRRVVYIHNSTGAFDIRVDPTATATATSFPVLPQRYLTIDAKKDDVISFFNTSGGTVVISLMEIE